ncbi:MAG: hypothetical protein BroJett018_28640 [Chloroflexota bacterium]|nr:MAG: hypothetical protein BroJett018_28640 [Chloroflexota bacterium]
MRIPAKHRLRKKDRIEALVSDYAEQLAGAMTTLTIANIRVRHLS